MNTIFWMTDELFAKSKPENWNTVSAWSRQLLTIIGRKELDHRVINPTECIGELAIQLTGKSFSSIIDLTDNGWLSSGLGMALSRSTPVVTELHISRVRDISLPQLPTSGHLIRTARNDISLIRDTIDLSHPLILDDVSFSGKSSALVMRMLSLKPEETTHGFLITNIGDLGPEPGALSLLSRIGSRVITGATINTPEGDDGWHIKDFVRHEHIERALGIIPIIHEAMSDSVDRMDVVRALFSLESTRSILFPNAITGEALCTLSEDQFIRASDFSVEGMHTTNPNLLTSPAFLQHISVRKFWSHIDEVSDLLHGLQTLTELPEGNHESTREMNRIVENSLSAISIERRGL